MSHDDFCGLFAFAVTGAAVFGVRGAVVGAILGYVIGRSRKRRGSRM